MKLFEKLSKFFSLASDFFRLDLPEEDDDILEESKKTETKKESIAIGYQIFVHAACIICGLFMCYRLKGWNTRDMVFLLIMAFLGEAIFCGFQLYTNLFSLCLHGLCIMSFICTNIIWNEMWCLGIWGIAVVIATSIKCRYGMKLRDKDGGPRDGSRKGYLYCSETAAKLIYCFMVLFVLYWKKYFIMYV